ncbi:MAG TPA: hypothetical protein VLJ86_03645, partial [Ramlibacter sp.]|nr:hypothetical protein [Ramlibacter sp.]
WPGDGSRRGEFPLVMGFALLLAGVTRLESLRGHLPVPRVLTEVGDASYSLYLLHLPLSGLLLKLCGVSRLHRALGGEATYLLVLAGAVALSWVAYRWVEAPLLELLRGWRPAPARRRSGRLRVNAAGQRNRAPSRAPSRAPAPD